jgi:hypothetical protein
MEFQGLAWGAAALAAVDISQLFLFINNHS